MRYRAFASRRLVVGFILCLSTMGLICDSNIESTDPGGETNVYYVAEQGTDDSDGQAPGTAFRTISHALKVVRPGDMVLIQPGTYAEEIVIQNIGSLEAPITIRGENGVPVLDGQEKMDVGIWCEQTTNIIFENLEIRNYTDIGIGVFFSSNITMWSLVVHHNGMNAQLEEWDIEGYGIHAEESRRITIENNDVYANGPQPQLPKRLLGNGINTYGLSDSTIRGNQSHRNIGGGILVEDGVKILVEDNQVFSNDLDASVDGWWAGGIWVDGGHDVTVRNNVFQNNKGPGIEISDEDGQNPYGYVLENNTSTENLFGIYVWSFGLPDFPPENILRMSNNQIFGNIRQDIWIVP